MTRSGQQMVSRNDPSQVCVTFENPLLGFPLLLFPSVMEMARVP